MEKQDLSKINIQEMYPEECKTYDIVAHCEVWHLYNIEKPSPGDIVCERMIEHVDTDGIAYFIKLYKIKNLSMMKL